MSLNSGEDATVWREKCQELEKVIKTLSTHCVRVVEKHEQLLGNYKKNQEQYNHLLEKLKEKGEQIKKAKEVLVPVTVEYQALKDKYETAIRCQYEAESYASKVNHKNQVLKRQSQMLLDKVNTVNIVDIKFEDEEEDADGNEYIKKLDQQITELEEEKSTLKAQVAQLSEDLSIERDANDKLKKRMDKSKEELSQAKETVAIQESTLQQLAKTSEAALQQYEELQAHYNKEIMDSTAAKKLAHSLYGEREAARRQSAMLMKDIGNEKRLMEALIEIEDLTTEMKTTKADLEHKIKLLEEELKSRTEESGLATLEKENGELMEEKENLLKKLGDAEKKSEDLRSQFKTLNDKYADLEKKYEEARNGPPPPPPPPPPPLPPPVAKTGGFLSKIIGGRKQQRELAQKRLKIGGAEVNADYSKAVDEMMKRIKEGNVLKPTLKKTVRSGVELDDEFNVDPQRKLSLPYWKSCPSEEDEGSAMKELQGILTKMKKARSEDDLSVFDDDEPSKFAENTELAAVFKRVKQPNSEKPKPAPRKLSTIKDDEA